MPDSVYKVIELVGTSPDSWEKAAAAAVKMASAFYVTCGSQRSWAGHAAGRGPDPGLPRKSQAVVQVPRA
jgi:hypothetical protein